MHRVEKHIIKKTTEYWNIVDEHCWKSKNLYNYANYIIRQEFINNNKYIKYNDMANDLKSSEPYRELGSNVGQQTLKILDKNWKSFFVGIKDYGKHPNKYLGRPKLPNYKDKDNGRFILVIDNIKAHIKDDYLYFS